MSEQIYSTGQVVDVLNKSAVGTKAFMDNTVRYIERTSEGIVWDAGMVLYMDEYTLQRTWRIVEPQHDFAVVVMTMKGGDGDSVPFIPKESPAVYC